MSYFLPGIQLLLAHPIYPSKLPTFNLDVDLSDSPPPYSLQSSTSPIFSNKLKLSTAQSRRAARLLANHPFANSPPSTITLPPALSSFLSYLLSYVLPLPVIDLFISGLERMLVMVVGKRARFIREHPEIAYAPLWKQQRWAVGEVREDERRAYERAGVPAWWHRAMMPDLEEDEVDG